MKAFTKTEQENISPSEALTLLKEGNARFLENQAIDRDLLSQVKDTQGGNTPLHVYWVVSTLASLPNWFLIKELEIFSMCELPETLSTKTF